MPQESEQPKLTRVRPPRVQITYDLEMGGGIENKELPFVVGVLADLSGYRDVPVPPLKDRRRRFVEIDRDSFNDVMKGMRPKLRFAANNTSSIDDSTILVELNFESMDDLHPEAVARQVPLLREGLLEVRERLVGLRSILNQKGAALLEAILHDQPTMESLRGELARGALSTCEVVRKVVEDGRMGLSQYERERDLAKQWVAGFIQQVITEGLPIQNDKNIMVIVEWYLAQIDERLSRQLNEIMHHSAFQALEAAWRGLHYLVAQTETSATLKIRVLNVRKDDLWKDLTYAAEFDRSGLYSYVYTDEYETFGGSPYGLLVGSYEFTRSANDIELLKLLSDIAAAAHAPFLSAAAPELFNLDSFTELSSPRDLSKKFDSLDYRHWKQFRDSDDSRYVGLVLPRILLRLPYGPNTVPVEGFNFIEDVDGCNHSKYLWGNAAYAMALRVTDAFAKYRWPAAIQGVEGGGRVDDLPLHKFQSDDGEVVLKCPTEIVITDRRERELSKLGFLPLVHCKGTNYAAFFGTQTCQKPKKYDKEEANANVQLSVQLQYVLAVSRFAHYLKVIMRDKIGSFLSRKECEELLNRWISNYVIGAESTEVNVNTYYPLREARIEVAEVPGRPGRYYAVAFLRPQFQLDELTVALRVVAGLPAPTN